MRASPLSDKYKEAYTKVVSHPLQSWEWGEFRKSTGIQVERLGFFSGEKLEQALQITFHTIPRSNFTVGYLPKGPLPNKEHIAALEELGKKHNAILIKLEPNSKENLKSQISNLKLLRPAARPLFTKYTFLLDLTQSEEQILKNMHSKTRYNIKVAQKHGVLIAEETSDEAFAKYIELTEATAKRQGFYAHTKEYHQKMWQALGPHTKEKKQIAHLFTARYKQEILVTWVLFLYNDVLYYPYGASSDSHREVMASNLMMWEAIRWGKKMGAKSFDLWGTPGPDPKPSDPYYGFHKFKLGYSPQFIEFIGSYDLVLKEPHYTLFTWADTVRWLLLKLKASLRGK